MTHLRTLASTLAGLVLACSSWSAHAAAAVAVAGNGKSFTATEYDDLERAKAAALHGCQKMGTDCTLTVWTPDAGAIALATGTDGNVQSIRKQPGEARDAALKDCRKRYKGCSFTALYWEPGGRWAAWAVATTAAGELVHEHFAHAFQSEAGARQEALSACTAAVKDRPGVSCKVDTHWGKLTHAVARSPSYTAVHVSARRQETEAAVMQACRASSKPGDHCKLESVTDNQGALAVPAAFDKVVAQSALAKEKALAARRKPPAPSAQQQVLSCTNRCVNGSCTRSFPNGRTERWQAPRVFDPLKNDWVWATSSCGG
ncbi:DUF4189 domain-containing protein [Massilia yuzhufengensis]|uniref:DUF4189 domain-containing protein n=1 Tax=Massilia yuzhufengensis TaxID=1164594 RepID=A0A1I1LD95_9BURK|nr:DUF4189 domain-containing protein [Massilia yuzhufengensis]SFC71097.1 protein of unknown function [Massilia yuzhufengensis]